MRINDELLDLLGAQYEEMVEKKGIDVEETPFYLFVERFIYLNSKHLSKLSRKYVVLCR